MIASRSKAIRQARSVFRRQGGMLRLRDAIRAGIHRDTLRKMLERGDVEWVSRGVYRLVASPLPAHPDLAVLAIKIPKGVVCLISALAFHELTTQIPHAVYLAVSRNAEPPKLDRPPIQVFRFTGRAFTEGIETHKLGAVAVRVYSAEKTIADCFKYRNKIGLDTCLEALRVYRRHRRFDVDALLKFAAICRVANVMRPYIEALL